MKTIARLLALCAVLGFGSLAQAQNTPGNWPKTISATGRTLLYSNGNATPVLFSGTYYTTGSPAAVTIAIETGNVLAGTSAPFGKIGALTNTTSGKFEEVSGGEQYWYANVTSLSAAATIVLNYKVTPIVAINFQQSSSVAASSLTFEGATADDFETTLSFTDPTADRTVTFANVGGTVMLSSLAANGPDLLNSVTGASNALVFEGTADGFEISLGAADATADRAITLPDGPGTVVLSSLATNAVDAANAVTGASNALVFEGATADGFEISLGPADATADRAITLPDGPGTVVLSSLATNAVDAANSVTGASNALVFEGATANAFELSVAPTDVGADVTATLPGGGDAAYAIFPSALTTNDVEIANSIWGVSNGLRWEGATADAFETTISPVDPTADQTVSIPNFAVAWAMVGSTLTTNTIDAANSTWFTSNNFRAEGATADANEQDITWQDPTADRTATFPNASGTVNVGFVTDVILCGQQANNGTIYMSPVTGFPEGNVYVTGGTYGIGGAGCDGEDNATEGTADEVLYANNAAKVLGRACKVSSSGANGVVLNLRSATASLTPDVTITIATGNTTGAATTTSTTDIAAGATFALRVINTEDLSLQDAWCIAKILVVP